MTAKAINKKPGLNLGKLSAVAQIAVAKPTQPADAKIELSRIFSVKQVRKTFRNLEELAESFKLNGIIEPLVVHEEPADEAGIVKYRIIVGERRYRAAPLAGLTEVPVVIKKGLNELAIRRLQVTENNERENLTAFEEAMGVIEDVEQYGTKEAMATWNRGEAWISKRMAFRRWAKPVCALLQDEVCNDLEILIVLDQIYRLQEDHHDFARLSALYRDGNPPSRTDVRDIRDRIKAWENQNAQADLRRAELAAESGDGGQEEKAEETAPVVDDVGGSVPAAVTPVVDEKALSAPAVAVGGETTAGGDDTASNVVPIDSKSVIAAPAAAKGAGSAAESKNRPAERLARNRSGLFALGEQTRRLASEIGRTALSSGDVERDQFEWILWQTFASVALPLIDGIGADHAMHLLKKLQSELKGKTPMQVWDQIHPETDGGGRNPMPDMPADWHF
jgi:ParB family chromosome partitioning protein